MSSFGRAEVEEWKKFNKMMYLKLFDISAEILSKTEKVHYQSKMTTDIRQIVKEHGIEIVEKEGIAKSSYFFNEIAGYLDHYGIITNYTIFLEDNQDELSKRYVLAYEFAHYLLYNPKSGGTKFCTNMLFFTSQENQLCDILAAFLMMPIESVLRAMESYTQEKKNSSQRLIYTNEWLRYLAYQFKLSDYHTTLCYQHIQYLGAILYHDVEKQNTIQRIDIEKYSKYFANI